MWARIDCVHFVPHMKRLMSLLTVPLLAFCGDSAPTTPTATWNCNPLRFSPNTLDVDYRGGSFTVPVIAHDACPWTVSNSPGGPREFITVTSSGQTGSGTVTFAVDQNTSGASREGTVKVRSPIFPVKPVFIEGVLRVTQAGRTQ
jgi:hypothetical protein